MAARFKPRAKQRQTAWGPGLRVLNVPSTLDATGGMRFALPPYAACFVGCASISPGGRMQSVKDCTAIVAIEGAIDESDCTLPDFPALRGLCFLAPTRATLATITDKRRTRQGLRREPIRRTKGTREIEPSRRGPCTHLAGLSHRPSAPCADVPDPVQSR